MMRKKETYVNITPIPSCVPRQLALDILHSHGEIITLNPLVLSYRPIDAPRDASANEYYSTWYEVTERVKYFPGIGKLGHGKINFKCCFHNTEWGLETHTIVPMGVDMKSKWRIADNQPNEPHKEEEKVSPVGGEPADGLYLREDIQIECNITLISLVKSQMKAASKVLVDRLMKKAELLDAGVLEAYMEDGKLKTVNPNARSGLFEPQSPVEFSRSEIDGLSESSTRSRTEHPRWGSMARRKRDSKTPSEAGQDSKSKSFVAELPGNYHHPEPQPSSQNCFELPDPSTLNVAPAQPTQPGIEPLRVRVPKDGRPAGNLHNTIYEMGGN